VPHGRIHIDWYQSNVLDKLRSMHVYTPPGYDSGNTKYPVFYLLHGGGDEDSGWSTVGRATEVCRRVAEQRDSLR
jgi:enterochelin esterase-like enzyme